MRHKLQTILSYGIYPILLSLALKVHTIIFAFTNSYLLGAYVSVGIIGSIIFLLEFIHPLHEHWKPSVKDLGSDLFLYTLVVQVIFPLSIYFILNKFLINLGFSDGIVKNIWPNHIGLFWQFVLLTTVAEFFQYWWHRLAHTYKTLWAPHAIHHMPQKLYSINTSRFHFFDKMVEFFITIFIFMMIGARLELISYYYIFFGITGFIQHCNLDVKLGWFDYIIASGETHRFHHDSNIGKGKCNYANNLVIWDLVFNTFKCDPMAPISEIGMKSADLPKTILSETLYPIKIIYSDMLGLILNLLTPLKMKIINLREYRKLIVGTINPQKLQLRVLNQIIIKNQETAFGKDHFFSQIKSVDDYKAHVPISDYEAIRKYVDRIIKEESNVLTSLEPHYFTKTSGTTGQPKYIPITKTVQNSYLNAQKILSYAIYRIDPKAFRGHFFTVVGSKDEETLYKNVSAGSMSGNLFTLMPSFLTHKHVFPKALAEFDIHENKYVYLASLALLSPSVTLYASPNPTTILKIFDTINSKKGEIIQLLNSSNDRFLKSFIKNKAHALKLLDSNEFLDIKTIWPQLVSIVVWKGGNCSLLLPKIKKLMNDQVNLIELGYLSSEFYGTITVDAVNDIQVPTILDNFFEFIEKNNYENGERDTLLIEDLKKDVEYYIIVTTTGGLYRYFINDIVKVKSFMNKTPVLEFIQKGKGITNFTGEKLSETQITNFFNSDPQLQLLIPFFMCIANKETQSYTLYVESLDDDFNAIDFKQQFNAYLCKANIEFESKLSSGRLKPVEIVRLQNGTGEKYKQFCISEGQRESQFKFLYLQYSSDIRFPFKQNGIDNE